MLNYCIGVSRVVYTFGVIEGSVSTTALVYCSPTCVQVPQVWPLIEQVEYVLQLSTID
jgi:hypothetical protein